MYLEFYLYLIRNITYKLKIPVDIDLERYFDTVNNDKLIGVVYKEVEDIRVILLIRKSLIL